MRVIKDMDEAKRLFDGPEIVFKYRSWNDGEENRVNRIITHREIRFSGPDQLLADYPECILPYDYENITEEELMRLSYMHAEEEFPFAPPSDLERIARNKRRRMKIFDKENQKDVENYYNNELYKVTGVFCTSYDGDSAVAWENLGCMGQNYCVGLKSLELFMNPSTSGSMGYVRYYPDGNPPKIRPFSFSEQERLEKSDMVLRSVPKKYEHESEYRFIRTNFDPTDYSRIPYNDNDRLVTIPLNTYDCILLGENIDDNDREEIVEASNESLPGVPIFDMIWDQVSKKYVRVPI